MWRRIYNLLVDLAGNGILDWSWRISIHLSLRFGSHKHFLVNWFLWQFFVFLQFISSFFNLRKFIFLIFAFRKWQVVLHLQSFLAQVSLGMIDIDNSDVGYAFIVGIDVLLKLNVLFLSKSFYYLFDVRHIYF